MEYISTIGLEIHIELKTKAKMFCGCLNDPTQTMPNVNVCDVCLAHPGSMPVINEKAVRSVLKTALALNCQAAKHSFFERKNYFYPDLPKGFQISQFEAPLSLNGFLLLDNNKKIRITRIHLEEDTGRLQHPISGNYSLVDFNRSGVPLMELVTEPDISSAKEASEFVKKLQLLLRYLNVSDANMELGQMRCEVNISIAVANVKELGCKVEIKNLNSLKTVEKAIEFEIKRQKAVLDKGEKVVQETRGFHDAKQVTFSQRSKEGSHDYRYFPEPDLPPLEITENYINEIKAELPELPEQKKQRFKKEYGLTDEDINLYVNTIDLGDFFEKVISELKAIAETFNVKLIKLATNYIASDLQSMLKGKVFNEGLFPITPENFAEFICMIYKEEISSKIAKMVLKEMFATQKDPGQIVEDRGLAQISDVGEIESIIKQVIGENEKPANDYKKGNLNVLQFLAGQVMAKTKGKANPKQVQETLKQLLS